MTSTIHQYLRTILFLIVPCLFIMASCEEELIGPQAANTPVSNFDHFWKTFDTHYGLFDVQQLYWNAMYQQFRPRVSDQMSDDELYTVLTEMIVQLNDNHVNLYPTNGELPVFPGGVIRYENGTLTILKVQEDYALEVVKNYVSLTQPSENIRFGIINNLVGYINMTGTDSRKDTEKAMDRALNELKDTQSLILDLRGHYGGMDAVSQYVAGRFTSETKLYMTSRKRNGPEHDQFTAVNEWYVRPSGGVQYTKPVIVLTSRFTQSAGETLSLALRELNHTTFMGDTTAGSFSDNPNFELPNGWIFSLSVGDYRNSEGTSFEGRGLPPAIYSKTTRDDLLAGKDPTLERAIELGMQ